MSIRYNRISDLPLTIRLLRNLCRLDITGNPFTRLPGAVFHLLGLETLIGLNDCPLMKDVANGWHKENEEISWRKPLSFPQPRDNVDNLKEYCIHAAVGMDCWLLSLPDRYCERLSKLAETLGLCENCLKPVRKLTVEHESQGECCSTDSYLLSCWSVIADCISIYDHQHEVIMFQRFSW